MQNSLDQTLEINSQVILDDDSFGKAANDDVDQVIIAELVPVSACATQNGIVQLLDRQASDQHSENEIQCYSVTMGRKNLENSSEWQSSNSHFVRFALPHISAKHAIIFATSKIVVQDNAKKIQYRLFVQDCSSSNGTFVNNKRINDMQELKQGDEVSLGAANSKTKDLPVFIVRILCKEIEIPQEDSQAQEGTSRASKKRTRDGAAESSSDSTDHETTDASLDAHEAKKSRLMPAAARAKAMLAEQAKRIMDKYGASTSTDTASKADDSNEEMEKELTCSICGELLYRPLSCIPCLHSFCSACLSCWIRPQANSQSDLTKHDTCPCCRTKISEVRKNHNLANMCDIYAKAHPNKVRSDEEKRDLDAKATISGEVLRISSNYDSDSDDDNDNDSDSDDDDSPVYRMTCDECSRPGPDGFQCQNGQLHVSCSACGSLMAQRSAASLPRNRQQQCPGCFRYFCAMYRAAGCPQLWRLPFRSLKDHAQQMPAIPNGVFSHNSVERQILEEYLRDKNIGVSDVFSAICDRIQDGSYSSPLGAIRDADTLCCSICASSIFQSLVYNYRRDIPKSDLPQWAAARPDCWYGNECRTQQHNIQHARKLNHICTNARGASSGAQSSQSAAAASSSQQDSHSH